MTKASFTSLGSITALLYLSLLESSYLRQRAQKIQKPTRKLLTGRLQAEGGQQSLSRKTRASSMKRPQVSLTFF